MVNEPITDAREGTHSETVDGTTIGDVVMIEAIDFFFNDTATTEIYTLSLHDALPIS